MAPVRTFTTAHVAGPTRPPVPDDCDNPPASALRAHEAASIYVVDDAPCLTELYTTVLERAGFVVKAFNERAEALAALRAERDKPDLLITDYRGRSMPVDLFMRYCIAVHPALRILMASGFSEGDIQFSHVRPDRFLRKPFTPDELCREIRGVLAVA